MGRDTKRDRPELLDANAESITASNSWEHAMTGRLNHRKLCPLAYLRPKFATTIVVMLIVIGLFPARVDCDDTQTEGSPDGAAGELPPVTPQVQKALTSSQVEVLNSSMEKALEFIARRQNSDGSFPTDITGQPGVTSLCVLAFMSRGHVPGKGTYGRQLLSAVNYVLRFQDPASGGIMALPEPLRVPLQRNEPFAQEAHYSHAISGHMLAEVYRRLDPESRARLRKPIELALQYARKQQFFGTAEDGGWRYADFRRDNNADLSVTSWMLMFLHAAKVAEFKGPETWLKQAGTFVRNTYDPSRRGFMYALSGHGRSISRGTMGAGMLSLTLTGQPNSEAARRTAAQLLRRPFARYNFVPTAGDRYHYSVFFCSQGMLQQGGTEWDIFYSDIVYVLTENQNEDGSWDSELHSHDIKFGNVYTTALCVLALSPGYQQLAIQNYKREDDRPTKKER